MRGKASYYRRRGVTHESVTVSGPLDASCDDAAPGGRWAGSGSRPPGVGGRRPGPEGVPAGRGRALRGAPCFASLCFSKCPKRHKNFGMALPTFGLVPCLPLGAFRTDRKNLGHFGAF